MIGSCPRLPRTRASIDREVRRRTESWQRCRPASEGPAAGHDGIRATSVTASAWPLTARARGRAARDFRAVARSPVRTSAIAFGSGTRLFREDNLYVGMMSAAWPVFHDQEEDRDEHGHE